ncbi:hypothetical protein Hanom_Chr13g01199831 [Helianthus anomalus]
MIRQSPFLLGLIQTSISKVSYLLSVSLCSSLLCLFFPHFSCKFEEIMMWVLCLICMNT